jgi:hypothetical protein
VKWAGGNLEKKDCQVLRGSRGLRGTQGTQGQRDSRVSWEKWERRSLATQGLQDY